MKGGESKKAEVIYYNAKGEAKGEKGDSRGASTAEPEKEAEIAEDAGETKAKGKPEQSRTEELTVAPATMLGESAKAALCAEAESAPCPTSKLASATICKQRHCRTPSLSQQSDTHSSSFRRSSFSTLVAPAQPLSPTLASAGEVSSPPFPPLLSSEKGGHSAPGLFQKQCQQLEEVGREDKKPVGEVTANWHHAEEKLEVQQEPDAELEAAQGEAKEFEKLRQEALVLERENKQLQAAVKNGKGAETSPSATSDAALQGELSCKAATIEAMEVEISNIKVKLRDEVAVQVQVESLEGRLRSLEGEVKRVQKEKEEAREKQAEAQVARGLEL
ncbi:hypothetical protein KEM55_003474, partial [Ascosphaera atra]